MSPTNVFKLSVPFRQDCVGEKNFLSLPFFFNLSELPVLIARAVCILLTVTVLLVTTAVCLLLAVTAVAYHSCSGYATD